MDVSASGCPEDVLTWVPSGQYLSSHSASVPDEVRTARRVPGVHLVHLAAGMVDSAETRAVLLAQPLSVLSRMVEAVPASLVADTSLDKALNRANTLRLPIRMPAGDLAASGSSQVLPVDSQGRVVEVADADYALVLPNRHLIAERSGDVDLERVLHGPAMPGQLRWNDGRAEVGLPHGVVTARYRKIDATARPAGASHSVDGIIGLVRELDNLRPGQALLVSVTAMGANTDEEFLAVRAPDGIALLRETTNGTLAATLPQNPARVTVTPAITPTQAVIADSAKLGITYLDWPGLRMVDPSQISHIKAAETFLAAADEYPVFVHGSPAGPTIGNRLLTYIELRDLIAADPRSRGKTIILVQCGATATGPTVVKDFATALFTALPEEHPHLYAMGGTAFVEAPSTDATHELTDIFVTRPVVFEDGRIRHYRAGIRKFVRAGSESVGPAIVQHGSSLATARYHEGVALTDSHGRPLASASISDALHPFGFDTQTVEPTGVPFAGRLERYQPSAETLRGITVRDAYRRVYAQRSAAADVAARLREAAAYYSQSDVNGPFAAAVPDYADVRDKFRTLMKTAERHMEIFESQTWRVGVFADRGSVTWRSPEWERPSWAYSREDLDLYSTVVATQELYSRVIASTQAEIIRLSRSRQLWRNRDETRRFEFLVTCVMPQYRKSIAPAAELAKLKQLEVKTVFDLHKIQELEDKFKDPKVDPKALAAFLGDQARDLANLTHPGLVELLSGSVAPLRALNESEQAWRRVSRDKVRQVIARVVEELPYGPANDYQVHHSYRGIPQGLVNEIRNPHYWVNSNESDDLTWIARSAFLAQYFGTGLMQEYASLAFTKLADDIGLHDVPITYAIDRERNTHFVILGPPAHPNSLVVDAWPKMPTSTTIVQAAHYGPSVGTLTYVGPQGGKTLFELGKAGVHQERLPPRPAPLQLIAPPDDQGMLVEWIWDDRNSGQFGTPNTFTGEYGYWSVHRSYREGLNSANSDSEDEADQGVAFDAQVPPGVQPSVHPAPQDVMQRLPDDSRPGLYLLDEDQSRLIEAAKSFRAASNEYAVFIQGSVFGPYVGGRLITVEQLRDMIVGDERSAGRDILAVVCDLAVTASGTTALNDFATRLFVLLPQSNKRLLAAAGVVKVHSTQTAGLTDVFVSGTRLGDDGRFRLAAGGIREIRDVPVSNQKPGRRAAMLIQHGPNLASARTDAGVALTDEHGTLLTVGNGPTVAALAALGIRNPERTRNLLAPIATQDAAVAAEPGSVVEAAEPPTWSLRLTDSVSTSHPNVYVISTNSAGVPQSLVKYLAGLVGPAGSGHTAIVLGTPQLNRRAENEAENRAAAVADINALNYLLEQFAQRAELPIVVRRGPVDADLLNVAEKYGVAVLHHSSVGAKESGSNFDIDTKWKVSLARPGGRTESSSELWSRITIAVLDAAAKLARPTDAVARISDDLGQLIWAKDLPTSRTIFNSLGWSPQDMSTNLTHVKQMIGRVPNQPALSVFAPVLEFGATGHANVVFDYAAADANRPATLLDAFGLEQVAERESGYVSDLTTTRLASMVTAIGDDPDATSVTVSLLGMINDMKTGNFKDAREFIKGNSYKLDLQQKDQWVSALLDLGRNMPNHAKELNDLSAAVFNCPPKS
ncbi:hypothetical protein [Micromonospora sp. NPDC049102]|uniref:hypothetical protein n=1 Tax=Micromonospora sp. NPDC049102 TaxID=3364265 RepID=UPI0037115742